MTVRRTDLKHIKHDGYYIASPGYTLRAVFACETQIFICNRFFTTTPGNCFVLLRPPISVLMHGPFRGCVAAADCSGGDKCLVLAGGLAPARPVIIFPSSGAGTRGNINTSNVNAGMQPTFLYTFKCKVKYEEALQLLHDNNLILQYQHSTRYLTQKAVCQLNEVKLNIWFVICHNLHLNYIGR